ncbi:MAG: hypothetical protein AMXMBFR7_09180 [Planctomycetota bacterium]
MGAERVLIAIWICAACVFAAEDNPPLPEALAFTLPQTGLAGAVGGLIDSSGKVWGWKLRSYEPFYHAEIWTVPNRASLEAAIAAEKPTLALGAELLHADGKRSVWRVREGEQVWLYDGAKWTEQDAPETPFDGSFSMLGGANPALGTPTGIYLWQGDTGWQFQRLLHAKDGMPGRLEFVCDQAGRWYAYYPRAGSLWALDRLHVHRAAPENQAEAAERGTFDLFELREIPVLDSAAHSGIGWVVPDAAGTRERPQLLAGSILLTAEQLRFDRRPFPAEGVKVLGQLASEQYAEREAALAAFKRDGTDGLWRLSRLLVEAKLDGLDDATRSLYRDLILDRVYRFEPGRSLEYARQLIALKLLPADWLSRPQAGEYRRIWRALEDNGHLDRVARVGLERNYREAHAMVNSQRTLQHNPNLLPFPIGGRADHHFECEQFDAWQALGEYHGHWFDERRKEVWLAMGSAGVWRVTTKSAEARVVALNTWNVSKVLGRDRDGQLWIRGVDGLVGITTEP